MDFLVLTFITSLISLALFSLLLTAEERAGARLVLSGLRRKMDNGFVVINRRFFGIEGSSEVGAFRQTLHFIIHRLIKALLALVARLEGLLKKLQHVNRRAARVYRKKRDENAPSTELKEVAEHAQMIKLSENEKREKRIEMLG